MNVLSFCPLPVGSLQWQPRPGAHALTVICKATFSLLPGESPLAHTQEAIGESDLCPFKRRADVLFLGRSHALPGRSTHALRGRLIVGALDKAIAIRADSAPAAVGLGPLAPTSPSRTALLGRHAATWDHQAWNTQPLPEDMDGAFFNTAPLDQQLAELTGNESIVLEHLVPFYPRLETRLAPVVPRATVQRGDSAAQEVRLRCDTLSIDGDRAIASLVFRGVVLLSRPAEPGVVTFTVEWAAATAASERAVSDAGLPALTFDAIGTVVASPSELLGDTKPVLPFIAGTSAPEFEREASAWYDELAPDNATGTLTLTAPPVGEVLPFQPSPQQESEEPPTPRRAWRSESVIAPQYPSEPSPVNTTHPAPEVEVKFAIDVPPPPMLGPIPVPKNPAPTRSVTGEPNALVSAPQTAPVVEGNAPVLTEPTPVELSVEQVATVAAELAEGRQERAKVIDAHGLGERGYRENERRWMAAIEEEGARGVHALRATYDTAYVAQVEKFRGPITLAEYARILAALDRGRTDAVLDALRIQRPALLPIVRLWTRKVAKDMRLADEATAAIREARRA